MISSISVQTCILIGIAETIILLVLIGTCAFLPGLDRWSRRYFVAFYCINLLDNIVFIFDMLNVITLKNPTISYVFIFLEYFIYSIPPVLLTAYLLYCCKEDWKRNFIFYITGALWCLFFILLISAQFTTRFYLLTPDLQLLRESLHPLLLSPIAAIMIVNLITLIIKRNKLSQRYFFAFMLHICTITIVTIIHAFYDVLAVLNLGIWIVSFAMYILILKSQIERYIHQQSALAQQKASILVLQMRPHFIYNTMTSIYYLCEQDPKKAQQVTLDFTSYLRKNFSAIASEKMIPFAEELEHTRAYLAVETTQFEDSLFVEYDIPHKQFLLPPLTLQPIVENSIKHVLNPDAEPLRIQIRTREAEKSSVIVIKDNGPGFDAKDVFNSNNALSNIKQRLELMCHGSITITTPEGDGTIVRIVIPEHTAEK